MTLHTRNHPHWSEGSWDNPILSPPPSLEDLTTDQASLTEPGENKEPERNGFVEVIGGILGEIISGLGNILGGVWDAGMSVLGPVVDGVAGFLDGIVRGIGGAISSIFGGGGGSAPPPVTEIDSPVIWSPLKADLEGALKPHFDKIDENANLSEQLGIQIGDLNDEAKRLNTELGEISSNLDSTNQRIEDTVGESGSILAEIEGLNDSIQEEFGPGGAVETQVNDLRDEINEKLSDTGEVGERMRILREDMESAISSSAENVLSTLDDATADLSANISSLEEATGQQYRDLNTQLWGEQGDINELVALNQERQNEINTLNTMLWGEQGELNALNEEMWDDQSELNIKLREFQEVQLQFNDEQTGFNQKMQEFNELQSEWNSDVNGWMKQQEAINALNDQITDEQNKRDNLQDEMHLELSKALEETQTYISRTLPIRKGQATENDHFRVHMLSNGNWRVIAKGDWVGQMVWQGVWNGQGAASLDVYEVSVDRQWDFVSFNHHASSITYWVNEGKPVEVSRTATLWTPPQYNYDSVFTWTAPVDSNYQIYFRVGWDAATYDDWYGIRVTKNLDSSVEDINYSYIVGHVTKRKKVGPVLPGQNGYRTMTVNEYQIPLKAGDTLRFQAHSSASQFSQRKIRTAWMDIGYIDPTQTGDDEE